MTPDDKNVNKPNLVVLGREQGTPDSRIVEELERFLNLAKKGRIKTLVISAEVPDTEDWQQDEIQSRWFEAHQPGTANMITLLGVAQNLTNAIGMTLYNMGYTPTDDEIDTDDD